MGDPATIQDFEIVFGNVIEVALAFAGVVFFIILIIGGFQYATSGGDPQKADAAKKTLTAAIGGLILIAMAFLILVLIQELTGAPVTEFVITQ